MQRVRPKTLHSHRGEQKWRTGEGQHGHRGEKKKGEAGTLGGQISSSEA